MWNYDYSIVCIGKSLLTVELVLENKTLEDGEKIVESVGFFFLIFITLFFVARLSEYRIFLPNSKFNG